MKKLLLILSIIFCAQLNAQTTFQKAYGTADNEQAGAMAKTNDGGFIMAGFNATQNIAYVVKTDSSGVLQWTKKYSSLHVTQVLGVSTTADGGYIVAGTITDTNNHQKALLLKIKANGTLQWAKKYGSDTTSESSKKVKQTTDKGYIVIGNSTTQAGITHVYIFKTDSTGALQWTKRISGNGDCCSGGGNDDGCSIMQTADGNFVLLATIFNHYASIEKVYIAKINAHNASIIWNTSYFPALGYPSVSDFVQTYDKGFIIMGTAGYKTYLVKTDTMGTPQWCKAYDEIFGTSIIQTTDSGFAFTGTNNPSIYKTTANGTLQWAQYFGNGPAQTIVQNSNGQFTVAGYSNSFGAGQNDFYLTKTNKLGKSLCHDSLLSPTTVTITCVNDLNEVSDTLGKATFVSLQVDTGGVEKIICYNIGGISTYNTQHSIVSIFPNPAQNNFTIETNYADKQTICIFDVNGKQVLSQTINGTTTIDASNLFAGVYNLSITSSTGIANKRLIIVK